MGKKRQIDTFYDVICNFGRVILAIRFQLSAIGYQLLDFGFFYIILSAANFPVSIAMGTPAGLYAHCPA